MAPIHVGWTPGPSGTGGMTGYNIGTAWGGRPVQRGQERTLMSEDTHVEPGSISASPDNRMRAQLT